VWHAQIVEDDYTGHDEKSKKNFNADGSIKPRRANLMVRKTDFFASLVHLQDGRYAFSGILNGWPGLACMELKSITCKATNYLGQARIERVWNAGDVAPPSPPTGYRSVRATLKMASWTSQGWAKDSPGQVWWQFAQTRPVGRGCMSHGTKMIDDLKRDLAIKAAPMPQCTKVHLFAHRYARGKGHVETQKELMTYHSALLLEWDHGKYCTLIELATLNGVGGRKGKSNWYDDKFAERSELYQAFPMHMVLPWKGHFAEVRVADVKAKTWGEFKEYVLNYTGDDKRFLDPHFGDGSTWGSAYTYDSDVRVYYRSQEDIMRYLINYMGRDRRYTELSRNCQSFATDFYSFLAGKKDAAAFTSAIRALYTNRSHLFLYDASMYATPSVVEK